MLQRLISLSVAAYLLESLPFVIASGAAYLITAPFQLLLINEVTNLLCVLATSFVYTSIYVAVLISFITLFKNHSTTYALISLQLSKLKMMVWQKLTKSDAKQM